MESTITRDGYVFLRTEGSTAKKLSVQRTDSDTTNPLAQIEMFGPGEDEFQGGLSFETINIGSPDKPTEERMRIHTNGNVGIGTTKPSEKLEVDGTVKATEFVGDGSKLTGISESKWSDAPGGDIYYGKGNVGIGTTIPSEMLHLASRGNAKILLEADTDNVSETDHPQVIFKQDAGRVNGYIGFSDGTNHIRIANNWPNDDADIDFITKSQNRMTIDGKGNVGIGTTDPKAKLHINGSVRGNLSGALRIDTGNGYVDIGPRNTGWSHFYTDRPSYYFNKEIRVDSGFIGSYNEDLQLRTQGTTRITIRKANGNVGYRTTSPPAGRLDVVSPWGDWIFLRQSRRTGGGGGFHIHNPWKDTDTADRNRLEIGYMTSKGAHKWGQFVIHGPTGNVGIGTVNPRYTPMPLP